MDKIRVGVRHVSGDVTKYEVTNTDGWAMARSYVIEQVPTAMAVMALIIGGKSGSIVHKPLSRVA